MCGLNSRACTTCAHIGPSWAKKIVADSSARNVNTRVAIKTLLTAEDPGPLTSFYGAVAALQDIVCHNCGKKGHYARNCAMRRAQAQYVRTGGEDNLEGVPTFVDGVGLRPIATLGVAQEETGAGGELLASIQYQLSLQADQQ
jgi:hypothetical protein